jgi:hypothetical protein
MLDADWLWEITTPATKTVQNMPDPMMPDGHADHLMIHEGKRELREEYHTVTGSPAHTKESIITTVRDVVLTDVTLYYYY